jgi:hypothetical protein
MSIIMYFRRAQDVKRWQSLPKPDPEFDLAADALSLRLAIHRVVSIKKNMTQLSQVKP